jgi:hypothetical protein
MLRYFIDVNDMSLDQRGHFVYLLLYLFLQLLARLVNKSYCVTRVDSFSVVVRVALCKCVVLADGRVV